MPVMSNIVNGSKTKHLTVRKKYQDFLEWLFQRISRFPNTQKFILGEEIGKLALKILEDLIVIQFSPQVKREKLLKEINLKLETFRSLMKLAHQMGLIGKKGFLCQEVQVNEIGRMVHGLVFPKS